MPLDIHIIHDKHTEYNNIDYKSLQSAIKSKTSRWLEYVDITKFISTIGAYDTEYLPMVMWHAGLK